jgi:signal transduction histidine kinase
MGTYGTGRQGEMEEEWDLHISLDGETRETLSFLNVIREENGMYTTHDYAGERDIPKGDVMEGVRDYAAIAAWAGDKPVGVICVDNLISGNIITEEQLEALRLFAGYAGLAIQNARLNATLEEDLTHRQTLIEELEAKNAELERFTYTVSHDLKSPLVTITGFLGYVEKDALAGDTARVKSGIERIYKAAQKMQNLLNDLLELSRIGRLMNEPENVPFNDIVREAVDHVRGRLEANKVQVEVQEALPVVRVDKIRLIEVVQNLLDNAAKFTASSPEPRIKIGSNGFNEKGLPILFVSDNGIGIAPKYHEKIFGLFDKLDPNVEGTGVGLTLVKRIIEVHGGKIWLESQPGMGTTFYFTLPGIPDEE